MNFAEAERRFAELRQQYQQGRLTAAQFDEQLRAMMVQDPQGRWWAKERETGAWHYYEAASQSWVRGEPPVAAHCRRHRRSKSRRTWPRTILSVPEIE